MKSFGETIFRFAMNVLAVAAVVATITALLTFLWTFVW